MNVLSPFCCFFFFYSFQQPKALRLECWQQICYSLHEITLSRWWQIKDSERENKLDYFPNLWKSTFLLKKVHLGPFSQ